MYIYNFLIHFMILCCCVSLIRIRDNVFKFSPSYCQCYQIIRIHPDHPPVLCWSRYILFISLTHRTHPSLSLLLLVRFCLIWCSSECWSLILQTTVNPIYIRHSLIYTNESWASRADDQEEKIYILKWDTNLIQHSTCFITRYFN